MPDIQYNQLLDTQERGLHYGDGLFETLLKIDGGIPLWSSHYGRLRKGCDKLQLPLPDEKWLLQRIDAETQGQDSVVIKVIVTRGRGGRGLKLPGHNQVSVFILKYPYTAINDEELKLNVAICQTRLPLNPNLAGLKHLNRLDYVLATIELEQMANKDEALLCDTEGYIVEGIVSNLFFCIQGEVYTPSLEFSGVEGVMRQEILNYLASQTIPVQIGRFYPELLLKASECFLCNSVHGVRPIHSIDDSFFTRGEFTQMLIQKFNTNRKSKPISAG
jgi:4-amino-4-deoxychorismate lyase